MEFLPRAARLADPVHARFVEAAPAPAHPVDAVLAGAGVAAALAGPSNAALARAAIVLAALRGADLTDRVAERPARARLAAEAMVAIAGIRAQAGDAGLARVTDAHARSTGATSETLGVVAGALTDAADAGLALDRTAGTAGAVHANLA